MLSTFSRLLLAGGLLFVGDTTVRAAAAGCEVAPAPATAQVPTARAPAAASRTGTQTIRRYSASPGTYRAPAMRSDRANGSSGPSYSATRKILGY
ncbi:MAG TPA: hypothetical protein VHC22_23800 [Pirellulales bacterium]|nr:hypothetical protein [Pirellulales bacterium]